MDTNVVIAWLADSEQLSKLSDSSLDKIAKGNFLLPPLAVTETLAGPTISPAMQGAICGLATLPVLDGYWVRAGLLRRTLLAAGRRAKLGDTLIAQACIDSDIPLLTLDHDFAVFAEAGGLHLA
ncbi:MAG: PIN domain-containing protein [Hyphomonadaceae bacterium]|nr:PIN domain-containing protein [Hyphomonadaceae bacterium]